MVARLFLFLLTYAAMAAIPLGVLALAYRRQLGEYVAKRRAIAQGRRNAKLLRAHENQVCFVCDELAQGPDDCFEPDKGWYHPHCLKGL